MNKQSLVALLVFLLLVVVVCAVGLSIYRARGLPIAASGQAYALEQAIAAYHAAVGEYPPAGSNEEVVLALQKENPQEFDFLLATSIEYEVYIAVDKGPDGTGPAVDVWGNPLQITLPPAVPEPVVVSAGPDGTFGNSDDITSEGARSLEPADRGEGREAAEETGA